MADVTVMLQMQPTDLAGSMMRISGCTNPRANAVSLSIMHVLKVSERRDEQSFWHGKVGNPVLAMLLILLRNLRLITVITFFALVLGASTAFLMTPVFTASATILPPQAPQSTASVLVGPIGPFAGFGSGAGNLLRNPPDMYVGILQSRTVADDVIEKFGLQSRWRLKSLEDARKALKAHVQFEVAKDGLIEINVEEHDPELASDLANAFVDELYRLNSELAVTEAVQRRSFFDQQLTQEKRVLDVAEDNLKKTQEKTGLIALSGQETQAIRTIAEIRAAISTREVEMQAMRTFATDRNPNFNRLQREIDALQQQLIDLQNSQDMMPGDIGLATGRLPAGALEYLRRLREVRYHESLFEFLSKQYEAGRIDEAKAAPIIQVVDRAAPPDRRSGPPRMLMTVGFGAIGFFIACLSVFMIQAFVRMRRIPEFAARLDQLSGVLRL